MTIKDSTTFSWSVARRVPIDVRRAVLAHSYDELPESDKFMIDCVAKEFLVALRNKGAGKRFSLPMARELLYAVILWSAIEEARGDVVWPVYRE
jgi:hypothetical protein